MKHLLLIMLATLSVSASFADSQHLTNIDCKPQLIRAGLMKIIGTLDLQTLMSAKFEVTNFEYANDSTNDYVLTVHAENDASLDYDVALKVLNVKTCEIQATFPY